MNKFDRIIAILTLLQSKKIIKAQYIADRFEISLRTVYRDIRTLENAGIPIIGEAGIGYSIMQGYHLPPVMFSENEATALVTAEKLFEKIVDPSTHDDFKSALTKIKSVLRSSEKENIENLDNFIEVFRQPSSTISENFPQLTKIFSCISNKLIIGIKYRAGYKGDITERNIEPVGVYFTSENWYLIAYCQLRNDYRNFRLDRVQDMNVTHQHFETKHPLLKEYLKTLANEQELYTVVLQFDKNVAQYVQNQKLMFGFTEEKETEEGIEMTFLSPSLENIARWLLTYTKYVKIQSPENLKKMVKQFAKEAYEHFV